MPRTLTHHLVTTADGVALAVDDSFDGADDNRDGAPVLVFLHGIAQSRLAFRPLLRAPPPSLAALRLVAFDLRGHGDGAASPLSEAQLDKRAVLHDLDAVLRSLAPARPILVPWSYGGVVVGAFLGRAAARGERTSDRLGGVVACAAAIKTGRAGHGLYGPAMLAHGKVMVGDDVAAYDAGCAAFVAGCTARPLPAAVVDVLVDEMRRVPAAVRRALLRGADDDSAHWAAADVEVGIVHGASDRVVLPAMSEALAAVRPGSSLRLLDGVGHLPWLEDPDGFGAAVAAAVATLR